MTWFLLRFVDTALRFLFHITLKDFHNETRSTLPVAHRCRQFSFFAFQLPPSYEQVIKEINQVQVNTTNNNNAAATPRRTITSATQTDFPEEIDSDLPQSNASNWSYLITRPPGFKIIYKSCIIYRALLPRLHDHCMLS